MTNVARPEVGQTVRITAIRPGGGSPTLKVGDLLDVGPDRMAPPATEDGFIWLQSPNYTSDGRYGWVKWEKFGPSVGQLIRITGGLGGYTVLGGSILQRDDVIRVGCVCLDENRMAMRHPYCPSYCWVSTGSKEHGESGHRYGWVMWEPVAEESSAPIYLGIDPASEDDEGEDEQERLDRLKSKCARQRRELRRVNSAHRLAKLEREKAVRALEDIMQCLLDTRRALRAAELQCAKA